MRVCRNGHQVTDDTAAFCPRCGEHLVNDQQHRDAKGSGTGLSCTVAGTIGFSIIVVLAIIMISTSSSLGPSRTSPRSQTRKVEYRVAGPDVEGFRASITLTNSDGGTEQRDVGLPYSRTYYMHPGAFAYLSAQNNKDWGWVSAEIWVDGVRFKSAESSGAYVIASCDGRVP
jgi:hypothetical protein